MAGATVCEQNSSQSARFSPNPDTPMKCLQVEGEAVISCLPGWLGLYREGTSTRTPPDETSGCMRGTIEVLSSPAAQKQLTLTDGVTCVWSGLRAAWAACSSVVERLLHVQILAELGSFPLKYTVCAPQLSTKEIPFKGAPSKSIQSSQLLTKISSLPRCTIFLLGVLAHPPGRDTLKWSLWLSLAYNNTHNSRMCSSAVKACFAGGKKIPLNTLEGRAVND